MRDLLALPFDLLWLVYRLGMTLRRDPRCWLCGVRSDVPLSFESAFLGQSLPPCPVCGVAAYHSPGPHGC